MLSDFIAFIGICGLVLCIYAAGFDAGYSSAISRCNKEGFERGFMTRTVTDTDSVRYRWKEVVK